MLIKSMAGDFEISVSRFEVENNQLVMVGSMGVWDARTYITARDLLGVALKLLNPRVLFHLLKVPFLLLASSPAKTQSDDTMGGRK